MAATGLGNLAPPLCSCVITLGRVHVGVGYTSTSPQRVAGCQVAQESEQISEKVRFWRFSEATCSPPAGWVTDRWPAAGPGLVDRYQLLHIATHQNRRCLRRSVLLRSVHFYLYPSCCCGLGPRNCLQTEPPLPPHCSRVHSHVSCDCVSSRSRAVAPLQQRGGWDWVH